MAQIQVAGSVLFMTVFVGMLLLGPGSREEATSPSRRTREK